MFISFPFVDLQKFSLMNNEYHNGQLVVYLVSGCYKKIALIFVISLANLFRNSTNDNGIKTPEKIPFSLVFYSLQEYMPIYMNFTWDDKSNKSTSNEILEKSCNDLEYFGSSSEQHAVSSGTSEKRIARPESKKVGFLPGQLEEIKQGIKKRYSDEQHSTPEKKEKQYEYSAKLTLDLTQEENQHESPIEIKFSLLVEFADPNSKSKSLLNLVEYSVDQTTVEFRRQKTKTLQANMAYISSYSTELLQKTAYDLSTFEKFLAFLKNEKEKLGEAQSTSSSNDYPLRSAPLNRDSLNNSQENLSADPADKGSKDKDSPQSLPYIPQKEVNSSIGSSAPETPIIEDQEVPELALGNESQPESSGVYTGDSSIGQVSRAEGQNEETDSPTIKTTVAWVNHDIGNNESNPSDNSALLESTNPRNYNHDNRLVGPLENLEQLEASKNPENPEQPKNPGQIENPKQIKYPKNPENPEQPKDPKNPKKVTSLKSKIYSFAKKHTVILIGSSIFVVGSVLLFFVLISRKKKVPSRELRTHEDVLILLA